MAGTKPMKDAAYELLEEQGGPLKTKQITERALAGKLIKDTGKTPEATMAAQLAVDVKRKDTRFVRTAPATYGLKGRDRKGQKAPEEEPVAA